MLVNQTTKMPKQKAIEILDDLINQAKTLYDKGWESVQFKKWEKSIEAAFYRIFDDSQNRLKDLKTIPFSPDHILDTTVGDGQREIMQATNNGIELTIGMLESYQDEIHKYWENGETLMLIENDKKEFSKIFISHSSLDKEICDAFVNLLEGIGIPEENIIYSSSPRHGVPANEGIFHFLRQHIAEGITVYYMLSDNYYESVYCLNEMGAAWVTQSDSSTFLLPNFTGQIKGVIDHNKKAYNLREPLDLIKLKNILVKQNNLQISELKWEEIKNRFLNITK